MGGAIRKLQGHHGHHDHYNQDGVHMRDGAYRNVQGSWDNKASWDTSHDPQRQMGSTAPAYLDSYISPYNNLRVQDPNNPNAMFSNLLSGAGAGAGGQLGARRTSLFGPGGLLSSSASPIRTPADRDFLSFFRYRLFLVVLLAIIVRLSFMFPWGSEFVQSMFYPFVAFQISIIGYQVISGMDLGAGQVGILLSILTLCGVKQSIIQKYKNTMGLLTSTFDDFTIYFFCFVIVHLMIPAVKVLSKPK